MNIGPEDACPSEPVRVELRVELDDATAWALAQFVKRVCWSDMRGCAVDDSEAYQIRAGVDAVRAALARIGYAPR